MRILNFGSANIDRVYRVPRFVAPGETLSSVSLREQCGGKGLNQSIALARAGAQVVHAGCVGSDGAMLLRLLAENGVDVSLVQRTDKPSGHAVIQVDDRGQNAILLYAGANHGITKPYIDRVFSRLESSDWLLVQNEINGLEEILRAAAEKGMPVALNPSPMDDAVSRLPLEAVSCFLLNETEGAALAGTDDPDGICDALLKRYPAATVVLTLGSRGAVWASAVHRFFQPAVSVGAVDTTGAGDTFTGYYLAGVLAGDPPEAAMRRAAAAAALAVSRPGAAAAIPALAEVEAVL